MSRKAWMVQKDPAVLEILPWTHRIYIYATLYIYIYMTILYIHKPM